MFPKFIFSVYKGMFLQNAVPSAVIFSELICFLAMKAFLNRPRL